MIKYKKTKTELGILFGFGIRDETKSPKYFNLWKIQSFCEKYPVPEGIYGVLIFWEPKY